MSASMRLAPAGTGKLIVNGDVASIGLEELTTTAPPAAEKPSISNSLARDGVAMDDPD